MKKLYVQPELYEEKIALVDVLSASGAGEYGGEGGDDYVSDFKDMPRI